MILQPPESTGDTLGDALIELKAGRYATARELAVQMTEERNCRPSSWADRPLFSAWRLSSKPNIRGMSAASRSFFCWRRVTWKTHATWGSRWEREPKGCTAWGESLS